MSVADRRRQGDMPPLSTLNLSSHPSSKKPSSTSTTDPASAPDSWEDEAGGSSGSSTPTSSTAAPNLFSPSSSGLSTSGSNAPPPTPITPYSSYPFSNPLSVGTSGLASEPQTPMRGNFRPEEQEEQAAADYVGYGYGEYGMDDGRGPEGNGSEKARPEKSTAAAARMIAAGLGVRQPKKTEEMKRYEKAVRERERGRIEKEKEERERERRDMEEARRAVWED